MKKVFETNLDQLSNEFDKLPEKPQTKFTAQEIVSRLYVKIKSALEKNYSFDEIAEIVFKANGTPITGAILKKEFQLLEPSQTKPKKKYTLKNPKIVKNVGDDNFGE